MTTTAENRAAGAEAQRSGGAMTHRQILEALSGPVLENEPRDGAATPGSPRRSASSGLLMLRARDLRGSPRGSVIHVARILGSVAP